ncbi:MAG: phage portal protein, partial [Gammaproteobacteria bacterium]|nr:phage portal protein [Gammaproteobacteria bacterium]
PMIADEDFSIEKISWSPRELLAFNQRQWSKEAIINAFGQSIALHTETANRANIEGALYRWMKYEIEPACTRISEKINEQIMPMYDGQNLFCYIDALVPEDKEFMLRQEQTDVQSHIRSVNEIRAARGLPPADDDRANDLFATMQDNSMFSSYGFQAGMKNGVAIHKQLKDIPIDFVYP